MNAFLKLNKGLLKLPIYWQLWLGLLVSGNMIAPLFFLNRQEAQLTFATMLASMALMTALTARFGFTRILGFGHILWVPLLALLFPRLSQFPPDDAFGIWMRALFVLNGTSLLIDAIDVARFVAGDRQETVPGL